MTGKFDRRQLLQGVAPTLLAGLSSRTAHGANEAVADARVDPKLGYLVRPLGDGVFWLTDGAYSTMFMVTSDGVIAVDAPPTLGERYLRAISDVTDKRISHLVYSHEHVDHIAAASLLSKGAEIVACRETAKTLARRKDPRRPLPTIVFDDAYTLAVGEQRLELAYHGPNHSTDNIFIYAPRQRVLMIVDVIYPGWMPYKNLGVAADVPGLVAAHRQILGYDFELLVGGHVSRPGTRQDVVTQVELLKDLAAAAERAYASQSFGEFLKANPPHPSKAVWDLHEDYEQVLVTLMYDELLPRWRDRLAGTETYLRDNCWAMLETYVVQGAADFSGL
jgi:glyoxylase-like metal-dependent hydrolase (beta-lactamase superfamily II)